MCGPSWSPCRTIYYAVHEVSDGSIIYLDGTGTSKDPYNCQLVNLKNSGIHLTKSVSFVGIKSRAYISCLHGNQWIVDGTKRSDGLSVNFSRVAFRNTSLRLFDAAVNINDTIFSDSEHIVIDLTVNNLTLVSLNFISVIFQQNSLCVSVLSKNRVNIFFRVINSTFIRNGKASSSSASILWLSSEKSNVDIQFINSIVKHNKANGIVFIHNKQGSTNFSIHQFKLEDNGQKSASDAISYGLISLLSAEVIMNAEFVFVYRIYATLLTIDGHSSKVSITNMEIDGFFGSYHRGGVVNIMGSASSSLTIKDSCFRNGKSIFFGGVVLVYSTAVNMTIQNCIMKNISSNGCGGALSVHSFDKKLSRDEDCEAELNIINSSFIDNVSFGHVGVLCAIVEKVVANITDSLFLRNSARKFDAVLFISTNKRTEISINKAHFIKNWADAGGIVRVKCTNSFHDSACKLSTDKVWFLKNKISAQDLNYSAILQFASMKKVSSVVFKNTYFRTNMLERGTVLFLLLSYSLDSFHSVIMDSCLFKENSAKYGALRFGGRATVTFKNSVFDSNSYIDCRYPAFGIVMVISTITMTDTTFVNNTCGAIAAKIDKASYFKIEHSVFERNRVINGTGGAMSIFIIPNNNKKRQNPERPSGSRDINVFIRNVLFKENIASDGGALTVDDGKIELLNCVFINNFAHFQSGQIDSFGSNEMKISNCLFKETEQASFIQNSTKFSASGFLKVHGSGKFQIRNTTITSNILSNEPLIFVTRAKSVLIDKTSITTCPLGSDIKESTYKYKDSNHEVYTVLSLSCRKCAYHFYSLQRGYAAGFKANKSFVCKPCPRGADCLSAIKSKPNFWGYLVNHSPPKLAFTICPFGYCKSPQTSGSRYNDCTGKRTGIMCGMCAIGYTETMLSTYCTPNEKCKDYWFWFLLLILVVCMAILFVFKPPFVTYSLKQVLWSKRLIFPPTNRQRQEYHDVTDCPFSYEESANEMRPWPVVDEQNHEKRQYCRFLEIVFYFYQIAQLLLSSYSLGDFFGTNFLRPVLGFFNFQPSFNKQGFLCPFSGLTPKTKLLFKVVPVFGTIVAIFFIYIFHVMINKLRRNNRPSPSSYLQAAIKTVFLGYVTLAIVSISLVRCVSVAGETRWFYNGNVICYQWWQYVSFVFIGSFAFPFIIVVAWTSRKIQHGTMTMTQFLLAIVFPVPALLFWLFHSGCPSRGANVEENQNFKPLKEMILGPYKKTDENRNGCGAKYWQSVLIARRFILVVIYCVLTEPSTRLFCMTLFCILVLCAHLSVKPFRNSLANNLESLSLLFLVILGLINLFKSVFVGLEGNIKGPLVTVFRVFQWTEFSILALYPCLVSILICLALFSLIIRTLFTCCRYVFQTTFRHFGQRRRSENRGRLLNICEEMEE